MKKFLQIFLILFFVNVARSQEPNDCANAIMVCGNGSFVSDASGIGNTQEVNGCSGFEHNSIWLEIHVVQSGTLGFNIIPADTNITVDYDFWVYGPYGVNPPCPTTATSPIRCCTTNPQLAGLTSNVTGMNGSTLTTQSGPGANGNGYVRWLNVVAGQSYYIAIDRPVGDGGFQLDWIGSATAGTGAFASPPTANTIPEYRQCSTSNVGIFQLSSVSSQVNANLTDNTVTYYASLSDAIAQLSELPDIMSSGPGPFTVYARVTDNITGCYSISSFDLVVYPIPVASLSVTNNAICSGDAVTVTISGTPNATIDYTVNSGTVQTAILNAAGTFSFSQALTTNTVYTLVSGRVLDPSGNPVCTQPLNDSETVTVNALPTATISGTASICSGNTAVITFNGTPNAIVTYTVDSSANQTITLDAAGTASVTTPVLTVNSTYNLISVALPTTPSCTQTLSGSASITVNSIPTATIAGTVTVCAGTTTTITFNGTPNTTVTYTVDSGANQTIVLDNTGTATLTTPILNATTVYTLISVTNTVTNCTQVLSGSATITVIALPTATVSGSTTICSGNTATLTFTGTPNATVTYAVDSGANQSLVLNGSGTATITTPILTSNSTYTLVSVASSGTPSCTQSLSTSAVITVVALPTASISGTTTICSGSTTTVTFTGTPNAVVTYTVDSGPNQTITLNGTGTASLTTPALTTNSTYNLISVALSGTPACGQTVTGSAVITVISSLTASISGTTSICSGNATNITFNGTPNATVTYTINSGANQTILLDGAGTASLTTPILNASTTYALVSVTSAGASPCSQAVSGSAVVTVSQTPTASISGTITICSGNTAAITFTGTPAATVTYTVDGGANQTITLNAGGTATINTPVLNANSTYNLVSVALGTAPVCSQTLSGSAIITVKPTPTIDTVLSNSMVCDGSSVTMPSFTSQPVGASFTWTNSNTNIGLAASGNGNIPTFTVSNTGTTAITATITVTPQLNGCTGNSVSFTITVNPIPLANPIITDYELCDYNNPNDGFEQFTLNTKDLEIANGQSNVTVTYYLTQADAIAQTNALPNLYTNVTNPQQIWINIKNNATGCNSVSSFNLVVHPLPTLTTPPTIFQCSNGATNQALFDLTINEATTTGGLGNLTVTYYHTQADADAPSNPIGTPSTYLGTDNEVVYIRVQDDNTGCYATTTQLLRVTQGPLAVTPLPLHYCDPNNDGFGVFDLNSTINQIAGGSLPGGVTVSFYETQTDAVIGANPSLTSPYFNINPWTQTIYVRVFYTLTGCANYVQLQLIVDPTPEATTPSDYHLCDYTGVVGQESFDLTTTIPQILGSINPALTTVEFYQSLTDAQNGTTGAITNVTNYLNQPAGGFGQTLYVRVETIATGCYDIVELKLVVDPLPNITQPNYPQYSLCDYDQSSIGHETFDLGSRVSAILLNQTGMTVTFYPSLTEAQNNQNAITNLMYINVPMYVQTLGIRITNNQTGCYSISTMDIRVEPLPTPTPPTQPFTICDGDQNGIACNIDLTTLSTGIVGGAAYNISFHETLTDAQLGGTTIPNPTSYCNINPFTQTLYVRLTDQLTGCWSVMPIVLIINPSPVAPVNVPDIEVCDYDNNTQDGNTMVNLTQNTAMILAQQPLAASNYTVEYYTTKPLAEAGQLPIIQTTNYYGHNTDTIWVRVEDNTTGCYNLGSFQLIINKPLLLTTPTPLSLCDDDNQPNNQFTTFDLTVRNMMINQGLGSGYTVTYYTDAPVTPTSVAIATPTAFTNTVAAVQTLGVKVTTPQGCDSFTTLDIRVLPVPTPLDPSTASPERVLPAECENATGSGVATIDLTPNAGYIVNGDPTLVLHYFPSQADLDNNTNEITTPTAAIVGDPSIAGTTINLVQYVYIAVSSSAFTDYTGRNCYREVKQGFIVNPLPTVAAIADYQICEQAPNNGFEVFDLTTQTAALLAGNATTPVSTYTVKFYQDAALTQLISNPTSFTNTTVNQQTIYVQVTNNQTGCKSAVGSFIIKVNPKPIIAQAMPDMAACDTDGDNDGQMLFTQSPSSPLPSLAGYVDTVLGATQTAPTYIVEFYDNQSSADAGISNAALTNLDTYQVHSGTYWVRVENTVTGCYELDSFKVTIEKLAKPVITSNTGSSIACVQWNTTQVTNDLILDSGITAANYTFNWYADGVLQSQHGATFAVTTMDLNVDHVVYTVEAVSINPPLLGCTSVITELSTFDVIKSGIAANLDYTVTNAFAENQIITVTNDGYGLYEYSMDDGPRQTSPVFENVSIGTHTIYVWDTRSADGYSCGVQTIENVETIDYPHYFTPNGDGYHDTWNIQGLVNQKSAKIYIFDRYGKLLKQISPTSPGWDGTMNGHLLPADDYWFTVDYLEQTTTKQFKAHFSLKR